MQEPDPANAAVEAAARWLATLPDHKRPRPIVPALRREFRLSTADAVGAIRIAAELRRRP